MLNYAADFQFESSLISLSSITKPCQMKTIYGLVYLTISVA